MCRDFDLLAAAEPANVNTAAGHPETARDEGPRPGEGKTPAATSATDGAGSIRADSNRPPEVAVSRIADAFARAGRSLPEENSAEWDAERAAAEAHLNGTAPEAARPPSEGRVQSDLPVAPKPRRTELNVSARVIEPTAAAPADGHDEHGDALQRTDAHLGAHRSETRGEVPGGR